MFSFGVMTSAGHVFFTYLIGTDNGCYPLCRNTSLINSYVQYINSELACMIVSKACLFQNVKLGEVLVLATASFLA